MHKKTPPLNPPWKIVDGIIILVLINFFAFLFRNFGQKWVISVIDKLPGGYNNLNQLLISSAIQTALFLGLIMYYVFIKYKSNLRYLGFVRTRFFHWIKVGAINGIVLFFIILLMGVVMNWLLPIKIKPQPIAEVIMSAQTKWEKIIPFIVASIFAPVSEELYFRGFLYPTLKRKFGIKGGILITSIIFGGLHYDIVRMLPLIFGGIWLNLLYERSGSIYTSMMAHSVWNGIMTILIFLVPQAV